MFGTIKSYLWGAVGAVIATLSAALWWSNSARQSAEKAARKAETKARRNEAARKHVQETTEATRDVEDDLANTTADKRRRKLREYAPGSSRRR